MRRIGLIVAIGLGLAACEQFGGQDAYSEGQDLATIGAARDVCVARGLVPGSSEMVECMRTEPPAAP